MATHSCILAWRNPWIKEPGGPQCMELKSPIGLSDEYFHFSYIRTTVKCADILKETRIIIRKRFTKNKKSDVTP